MKGSSNSTPIVGSQSLGGALTTQKVTVALIGRIAGATVTAARRNCLGSSDVKSQTPREALIWSFKDVLPM
jgi:hypothetical protein